MRLIDADELYEKTAEWEASALAKIEELNRTPLEEMDDAQKNLWRKWTAILNERSAFKHDVFDAPTIEPQQWIPVKMRPMDAEEREYWEEHTGFILADDMARTFDCPMPDDGQRIWVQTKNGFVFDDVCDSDCDGIGLEGNGDWDDIVAWMPMLVPEPWEGGES